MTALDERPATQAGRAWRDTALCRDNPAPDLWFPHSGQSPVLAIAICRRCPVALECLDDALAAGPHLEGVYGGLTDKERRKIIDGPKRRECGHHLAYQDHRRRGEDIDPACQEAWNEYQRAYRAKRKAREAAAARSADTDTDERH